MLPFHALPGTLAEGLWDTLFFSSPDFWEVFLQNTTSFYIDSKRAACLPPTSPNEAEGRAREELAPYLHKLPIHADDSVSRGPASFYLQYVA